MPRRLPAPLVRQVQFIFIWTHKAYPRQPSVYSFASPTMDGSSDNNRRLVPQHLLHCAHVLHVLLRLGVGARPLAIDSSVQTSSTRDEYILDRLLESRLDSPMSQELLAQLVKTGVTAWRGYRTRNMTTSSNALGDGLSFVSVRRHWCLEPVRESLLCRQTDHRSSRVTPGVSCLIGTCTLLLLLTGDGAGRVGRYGGHR